MGGCEMNELLKTFKKGDAAYRGFPKRATGFSIWGLVSMAALFVSLGSGRVSLMRCSQQRVSESVFGVFCV